MATTPIGPGWAYWTLLRSRCNHAAVPRRVQCAIGEEGGEGKGVAWGLSEQKEIYCRRADSAAAGPIRAGVGSMDSPSVPL